MKFGFYAFLFVLLSLFSAYPPSLAQSLDEEIEGFETFIETYRIIEDHYLFPKPQKELLLDAVKGMVGGLDEYSGLLTAEEMKELEQMSMGYRIGIGIEVIKAKKGFVVKRVAEGSPAFQLGIKRGTEILSLDGVDLGDVKQEALHKLARGKVGTKMKLRYRFSDHSKAQTTEIARIKYHLNSVELIDAPKGILVLKIHQFQKNTPQEVASFLNGQPVENLVLDLRDNPGGLLVSAVEVANLLLDKGRIVEVVDPQGRVIETHDATGMGYVKTKRIFLLVNQGTASAAEILAGAIKDLKAGELIGERTFGKGIVQTVYPVSDDLFLKLTTARYYTASKVGFHQKGIEPDLTIEDSALSDRYGQKDAIFQAALKRIGQSVQHIGTD